MKTVQVANTVTGEYDVMKPLPYPYHVLDDGKVDRQEFWRGEPDRLLGFQKRADVQHVDVLAKDWLADDTVDVTGMFPVFVDADGTMWNHQWPVMK